MSQEAASEEPAQVAGDETIRGGAITKLGRLQPPLIPTPVKAPGKQATIVDVEADDEVYASLVGEKCAVCGKRCTNVQSLQEHIMSNHITQPIQVLEMLQMQKQILNTILANQSTQEKTIENIAHSQTVVITDIKELKRTAVLRKEAPRVQAGGPLMATPMEATVTMQAPRDPQKDPPILPLSFSLLTLLWQTEYDSQSRDKQPHMKCKHMLLQFCLLETQFFATFTWKKLRNKQRPK